jgi:putative Holliday junction resolvase
MRVIGLDIGEKTIGVAVSDPFGWTAQGIKTVRRVSKEKDVNEIINIIKEYNIERIVAGLPKNMNGSLGHAGDRVKNFCDKLQKKVDMEIIYQDERLTTVAAEKMLIGADVSRKKRKEVIDTVAATYILQSYLDKKSK